MAGLLDYLTGGGQPGPPLPGSPPRPTMPAGPLPLVPMPTMSQAQANPPALVGGPPSGAAGGFNVPPPATLDPTTQALKTYFTPPHPGGVPAFAGPSVTPVAPVPVPVSGPPVPGILSRILTATGFGGKEAAPATPATPATPVVAPVAASGRVAPESLLYNMRPDAPPNSVQEAWAQGHINNFRQLAAFSGAFGKQNPIEQAAQMHMNTVDEFYRGKIAAITAPPGSDQYVREVADAADLANKLVQLYNNATMNQAMGMRYLASQPGAISQVGSGMVR